jgi:RNA polymerase sigma-70 factor (ECF subfamily)
MPARDSQPPVTSDDDRSPAGKSVRQLAEHLFRHESGKLVSILTGIFGTHRLQLAEDVVQEALIRAMKVWPFHGVPENPPAWLLRTARNLALDQIRRESNFREKLPEIVTEVEQRLGGTGEASDEEGAFHDDPLRLMFVCCHPVLPREVQSALALKTLCGFSPAEIAKAFLITEAAVAKRLTRARQRLRDRQLPFEIPVGQELEARLGGVHGILYLLFNEGYKASQGEEIIRAELCAEAIRLGEVLVGHPTGNTPATHALLALMLLSAARLPGRVDADGNLYRLEEQDRSRWDRAMIERGIRHLGRSAAGEDLSEYHLQAGIAACHSLAADDAATDWPRILSLYDRLMEVHPSPVIALNRAVAAAKVHGPDAGIRAVAEIADRDRLENYHLLHAVLGELEMKRNGLPAAAVHFRRALDLAETKPERVFIADRLEVCLEPHPSGRNAKPDVPDAVSRSSDPWKPTPREDPSATGPTSEATPASIFENDHNP